MPACMIPKCLKGIREEVIIKTMKLDLVTKCYCALQEDSGRLRVIVLAATAL